MADDDAPGSPSRARSSRTSRASSRPSGISREVVGELSKVKGEPDWMAEKRLKSLEIFERKPMPDWGADLARSEPRRPRAVLPSHGRALNSWDDVPQEMKQTYEDLGIPQAEREHLAGVVGVWRQEPVYEGLKEEYRKLGSCSARWTPRSPSTRAGAEVLHDQVRPRAGQQVLGAARRGVVGRSLLLRPQGRQGATSRCSPTSAWRAPARAPSSTR